MPPLPDDERCFVSCEAVLAHRDYREDRLTIHRTGETDPFALIALPTGAAATRREVLAAFGWHLDSELEYLAGPNQERGEVDQADPAPGPLAEQLREAVRREIRARLLVRAAHPGAAHIQPVLTDGDDAPFPIGWTFRIRHRPQNSFAAVTAAGHLTDSAGTNSRAEAAHTVRHWHALGTASPANADPEVTELPALPGPELARLLLAVRNGGPVGEHELVSPRSPRSLTSMKSRRLAPNRCLHHRYARADVAGDPVAACAATPSSAVFGVLIDEGVISTFGCAVEAANESARLNGRHDLPVDPFFTWGLLCADHGEQPADGCTECAPEDAEETAADDGSQSGEDPSGSRLRFVDGDRIVCADGVTRTARGMAPLVPGEPEHVIVEGGTQWIAANCRRANREDILAVHERSLTAADRIHRLPYPGRPDWAATLKELGEDLDYLKAADPIVRDALVNEPARQAARRVHPDAHQFQPVILEDSDQAMAFTFRTGYGTRARYGVVTVQGEISEVGVFEYPTTAERAFRQHLKDKEDAVEFSPAGLGRPPLKYKSIPVPAEVAAAWATGAAAYWRNGVDAVLGPRP